MKVNLDEGGVHEKYELPWWKKLNLSHTVQITSYCLLQTSGQHPLFVIVTTHLQ